MRPRGEAQLVLKALEEVGLSEELLQQVHQSLVPVQSQAVERHREQLDWMQEKMLSMTVEEDKMKEELNA